MEYIDSELAKRRGLSLAQINSKSEPAASTTHTQDGREQKVAERQPATVGKLMEIDLGNEARNRNVQETERARRKAAGEQVIDEDAAPKKIRLGPDGKPWRGRKRKTSEEIKRDKLVEDVFRENRRKFACVETLYSLLILCHS